MAFRSISKGNILSDGTEQTILQQSMVGRYSGYVDLAAMVFGDTFVLRQYIDIAGIYVLYHTETYHDIQTEPAIYVTNKEVTTRIKYTLQRTGGIDHIVNYDFTIDEFDIIKIPALLPI